MQQLRLIYDLITGGEPVSGTGMGSPSVFSASVFPGGQFLALQGMRMDHSIIQ